MPLRLTCAGLILQLAISGNLLTWIGIPYVSDGGSLALKIHPASYLFVLAGIARLSQAGRPWAGAWRSAWSDPLPAAFIVCMVFCMIDALVMTGCGTLIVFMDTFLPAGFLAVAMRHASPSDRRILLRILATGIAINAALALIEGAAQFRTIPLYLNGEESHADSADFRPTALYDHPLTGSVATMIGLILLARSADRGPWRIAHGLLLGAALLAFGGRTAVAVMLAAGACWAARLGVCALFHRRRLPATVLLPASCAAIALPAIVMLTLWTGLGTRLLGHLYWDASAQVRLQQWDVLGMLRPSQLLFGCGRPDLLALLTPLRLQSGVAVIENFWLLMFLYLGAVGFPVFVTGFAALLAWCVRQAGPAGPLLVGSVIAVASGSNSLGRKSNLLVLLAASAIALGARTARLRRALRSHSLPSPSSPDWSPPHGCHRLLHARPFRRRRGADAPVPHRRATRPRTRRDARGAIRPRAAAGPAAA